MNVLKLSGFRKGIIISILLIPFSFFSFNISAQSPSQGKKIAYQVNIPQRIINGKTEAAKTYDIEQLEPGAYVPGAFHIKFKNKPSGSNVSFAPSTVYPYLKEIGATNMRCIAGESNTQSFISRDYYGVDRIYEISYSADIDPYVICKKLTTDPSVEYAVPVFVRFTDDFTPNDPRYSSQYALSVIKAAKAWDITKGDSTIVIAVLDVGTYWTHEDLAANIWTNPNEIPGNGIDDDSSGKIDDIRGWDFVGNITTPGTWKEDNNPTNTAQTHGTHTAGLVSAVTNNGKGVASIGYKCRIMPIKLGSDNAGMSGIYRGYDGILYAAKMGADVINCSWGGSGASPAEEDIVNQATAMGTLIVAASGNYSNNSDEAPHYPGAYPNVLNVGSTNASDQVLGSSNYGFCVSVFAPGENVLSTYPNNQYQSTTGTSMASPITAGLAGLVKSVHKDWTPLQVSHQIRGTCDKIGNDNTRLDYFGRINAYKAVMYNNDSFPSKTIPGIYTAKIDIEGDTAIKTYNNYKITFYLTNCLSKADTLHVALSSLDNYVTLDKTSFDLYDFKNNDTVALVVNVSLQNEFPWSDGKLDLVFNYTSRDYYDLEKNHVKVDLPGGNKTRILGVMSYLTSPLWSALSAPAKDLVWGIGTSRVYGFAMYFVYSGSFRSGFINYSGNYVNDPIYCIGAANNTKALAGTGKGYVYRTNGGGATWSRISVSNFTDFINAIHFYNDNEAIVLGDPKNNLWGVGYTKNGGLSIEPVDTMPLPMNGETGLVGSSSFIGKMIWFGTTKGRLYFSPDSGKSWTVDTVHLGGVITQVAFSDKNKGIVVYKETSNTTDPLFLASTGDGGKTWNKRISNLSAQGMSLLNFAGLPSSKMILTRYERGDIYTTDNLGTGWSPVLSEKSVTYQSGDLWTESGLVQLWGVSTLLTLVEFNYQMDSTLGTPDPVSEGGLKVYPNPVAGEMVISPDGMQNSVLEVLIYDQAGKLLDRISVNGQGNAGNEIIYHTGRLEKGAYILKIRDKNGVTASAKFIKI